MASRRVWRYILGLAVSALALVLVLRDFDASAVLGSFARADLRFAGLAVAAVVVANLGKAARWRVLLGRAGAGIPFYALLFAHLAGQLGNAALPARAGDFGRAFLVDDREAGRGFVLGTVAFEKLLDLSIFAALSLAFLALHPLPDWFGGSTLLPGALAVLIFAAALLGSRHAGRITGWIAHLGRRMPPVLEQALGKPFRDGVAFLQVLRDRRRLLALAAWSALIWGLSILINDLAMRAVRIDLPWQASLLILIVLQVGIAIPTAPGNLGVFEYLCVLVLGFYGVRGAPAVSYGLLLHAIVFLPVLLGGLSGLWILRLGSGKVNLPVHESS